METFILLKKFLRFGGILQFDTNIRGHILRILINFIFYSICLLLFLSTFWYFSFKAKIFREYVECLYFLTSSLLMTSWYTVCLWQSDKYTLLFSALDEIVMDRSKKN